MQKVSTVPVILRSKKEIVVVCFSLFFLTLNCAKSIQLSPIPRDPVWLRSRIQMHKEKKKNAKKKRLFLTQPLSPPKRGVEGGERKNEEEERRKKRQSFPLSLPLSDDASLYYTYKKPSSLGRAGIQTVVHFRI